MKEIGEREPRTTRSSREAGRETSSGKKAVISRLPLVSIRLPSGLCRRIAVTEVTPGRTAESTRAALVRAGDDCTEVVDELKYQKTLTDPAKRETEVASEYLDNLLKIFREYLKLAPEEELKLARAALGLGQEMLGAAQQDIGFDPERGEFAHGVAVVLVEGLFELGGLEFG